ncbi:MAG: DUF5801 repeats-in-toxin domain-containing protein, partial [Aeromonas veronii]
MLSATDGDGDPLVGGFPAGSFVINVQDDVPELAEGEQAPQISGLVNEDALAGSNADSPQTLVASGPAGTLYSLVNFGADGAGTVSLGSDLNTLLTQNLSADGKALVYSLVDGILTATAGEGGAIVFTLAVNGDGSYRFELLAPLDHPLADGNDDETLPGVGIDFSGLLSATDGDGDPLVGGFLAGSFVINVQDDVPELAEGEQAPQISGLVNEDALAGGNADSPQTLVASGAAGTLYSLVNFGADGAGTISLGSDLNTLLAQNLSADGKVLVYSLVDGILTATAGEGGVTVFTLAVNGDGSYRFELLAPLDHPLADGNDDETLPGLGIDFSGLLSATDGDGDPLVGRFPAGSFVINVQDDVPELAEGEQAPQVSGLVNEDALAGGNADSPQTLVASGAAGTLYSLVNFGADGAGTVSLGS